MQSFSHNFYSPYKILRDLHFYKTLYMIQAAVLKIYKVHLCFIMRPRLLQNFVLNNWIIPLVDQVIFLMSCNLNLLRENPIF